MKKGFFLVFAAVLVAGLIFYVPEGRTDHTMGPEVKGADYGAGSTALVPGKTLERQDAKVWFQKYLRDQNKADLKLGKIEEDSRFFRADILDQNNLLVDIIQIDKKTGTMKSAC